MSVHGIIYCIKNLVNEKMYVGQTIKSLEERWAMHRIIATSGKGHHLHASIRKHGVQSFSASVIDTCSTDEELNEKEILWISKLGTYGPGGYNETLGGDGVRGLKWSSERLRDASIAVVAYDPLTGERVHEFPSYSAASRAVGNIAIHSAVSGHIATASGLIWKKASESFEKSDFDKNQARYCRIKKRISAFNKQGEYITSYSCARAAATATGVNVSNIHTACKSKRTTTFGGYLWRYDGDIVRDDEIFRASISTRIGGLSGKHIMLVSSEGQELRRFISCAQAARELGLKQHQVARCVSGRLKNVSGFIFRVADEV